MIPNELKRLWAEGRPTLNGWLSVGNAFTAEIMAAQGYDSLTVDVQHGALDYAAAEDLHAELLAARTAPVVVLDAAGVTTMSTTAVLVTLSFLKGRADLSPPAVVRDPAGPFVDAFSQLGLFSSLMRMEFRT